MARKRTNVLPKASPHVRWMIRRDMPEVLRIEGFCFEFAWAEDDFIRCLRQRNCIGMVAEILAKNEKDDRLAGFMLYELHRTRIRLLKFAVHPDLQRKGIGRAMVDKLRTKMSVERRSKVLLEVRESNVDAQLFFRAMGFRAIDTLRNFYEETDEDAYVFRLDYQPTERTEP